MIRVGRAGSFVAIDYDAHYANGSVCDGGCVFGPNTVALDPLVVGSGPALMPASPLRNRGDPSVGYDVNGAEPGDYCESGPEIGSAETCP